MPGFNEGFSNCLDFHLIDGPRPEGPTVGIYADHPFSEVVADHSGRRFTYAGIAPKLANGQYDLAALRAGEFIVEPGLLYRLAPAGHSDGIHRRGMRHLADSCLRWAANWCSASIQKLGIGNHAFSGTRGERGPKKPTR
jgi:hypothetical protein